MCGMERSEPSLVPQWYRLGTGSTGAGYYVASRHSDENGFGLSSRNSLVGDRDRKSSSLKRNLSSNGSISGKSQAYSSFHRSSRERNQEKSFHLHDRENRYDLIDNGVHDQSDFSLGGRTKKDTFRHSLSMITERRGDTWPKKIGSTASKGALSGVGMLGGIGKSSFDKDFPSLGAEGRQGLSDVGSVLSVGPRTAVQSLSVGRPVIIGTSALAEVPGKLEANGLGLVSAIQAGPLGHVPASLSTTNGLNMAEALAQAPSQTRIAPQLATDTQKIEELTLKKCKQLIPVTPSMPKAPICTEKAKPKGARGVESSALNKVCPQSALLLVNHAVRSSAGSDTSKPFQAGNLQVLNREKSGNSPTAKDGINAGEIVGHMSLVPSAAMVPLKSPVDQKLNVYTKGSASQTSFAERKSFSLAQNRNEFFNLLRKKSSGNSNTIPESLCSSSPVMHGNNSVAAVCGSDSPMENGNCSNGCSIVSEEPELPDNGETNSYPDHVDDPEEEAFLQSLGWDKNVTEEALTKEEIDGFLKKYQMQRPSLKLVYPLLHGINGANQLNFDTSSS